MFAIRLLIILISLALPFYGYNQCDVTIDASTLTVPCGGGNVTITANGSGYSTTPINNDFNNGTAGPGWNVSPAGQFDNPCDPSLDGTTYMWMGNTTAAPRTLETAPLDLSCGGEICFDLDFATQGGASPCEGPDISATEGVYLEYSTNNGATWNQIFYFEPNTGTGAYTAWDNYCFPIPAAAQTNNTLIHWYQGGSSGTCCDHWGIDNVVITASGCGNVWYDWSNTTGTSGPAGDPQSQTIFVDQDTTITVTYTDGAGFTCTESVTITVNGMGAPNTVTVDETCLGDNDGEVSITENGGVGPFDYNITNGPGAPMSNATGDFTNLAPGNYDFEIIDNGSACTVTGTFTINAGPNCCLLAHNENFTDPTCDNTGGIACNGSITINANNGTGALQYSIDNGTNFQAGNVFNNLCAGTYDILVEDAAGCTSTSTVTLTDPEVPTADFTFTEVCEYLPSDFTDNSAINAPGVIQNYFWDIENDGNTDYASQNANHQYAGYGTFTVEFKVETDLGCMDSITYDVDVHPQPTADFDANPLCLGLPTDFQDQSTVDLGAVDTWTWDFGDGSPIDNTQNPNHQYGNAGQFNVNLIAESDQGCTHDTTMQIEIFDLPTADFNFNNECFNEDIVFQENASANSSQFEWDFGDGNTSNQQNPQHQYTNDGDYTVELIVTTATGNCKDTIEQIVTAYPLPEPDFTLNNSCLNDVVNVTDQSVVNAPSTNTIFSWTFGDGNTGNGTSSSNTYANEGIYDIQLTVETDHGCIDSVTQQVTVYPLPNVDFTPTDVCLDYATQFNDQSTVSNVFSNNNNVQWNWDFDDGNTANVQNPVHTYTSPGVYDVELEVTTNNGCTNTETIPVTVYPPPQISFTGNNLVGCAPLCFDLQSTSSIDNSFTPNNPSSITDIQWNLSGGFSANTGTDPYLNECFENNSTSPETYDVQLIITTDKGCVDSVSANDYIQVNDNPVADFTYNPQDPTVVEPIIQMNNQSVNADSYEWNIESVASSSEENPEFEFVPEPDTYQITLTAITAEGCEDVMRSVVEILDELLMYVPNTFTPDQDDFNEVFFPVMTSGFNPYEYTLLIYNRFGEPVFESHNTNVGWNGTYQGKLCKEGVYVWKIIIKDSKYDDKKEFYGHVTLLK